MAEIKARRQRENNEGFLWQLLLCYYAHRLNGAKLLLETKPSSSFESVNCESVVKLRDDPSQEFSKVILFFLGNCT
ncbi:hypothetical protein T4A_14429 [Trichinella pseudospiralis]|uniref:Uncharacterized protein n=1 Tax=Trichinella pseudospiralis TaxID=6337 RepID=A0A0V1DSD2_TRIPS|nr:hypothetical protein T4A_14429 [Trichinella pseudospiralis]